MNNILESLVDMAEPVVDIFVEYWYAILAMLVLIVLFILGPIRWVMSYFGIGI